MEIKTSEMSIIIILLSVSGAEQQRNEHTITFYEVKCLLLLKYCKSNQTRPDQWDSVCYLCRRRGWGQVVMEGSGVTGHF